MSKFNIDKVVCINLKPMDLRQIFSISETYSWGFEQLIQDKKDGCNKIYVSTETGDVIALEEQLMCKYTNKLHEPEFMICNEFSPVTKKVYDRLKNMKPVRVPKVPKTERSLNAYLHYLDEGYDIKMPSLDRKVEYLRNKLTKDKEIEPVKTDIIEVSKKTKKETTLEIDTILDKINEGGIKSLSKGEKDFLDNLYK